MTLSERLHRLFRRQPITEEDLAVHELAKDGREHAVDDLARQGLYGRVNLGPSNESFKND